MSIPPRANLCELQEVKVLRSWAPGDTSDMSGKTVAGQRTGLESLGIDMTMFCIEDGQKEAAKQAARHKAIFDLKVRQSKLEVGDRVLVKIVRMDKKQKPADRWLREVYVVTSQPNTDIPVYCVRLERGEGQERVLHRNLLLPFYSIPASEVETRLDISRPDKQKKRVSKRTPVTQKSQTVLWTQRTMTYTLSQKVTGRLVCLFSTH